MVLCGKVVVDTKTGKVTESVENLTLPVYVPKLVRDLNAEVDELKAKVAVLEAKP